MVEYSSKSRAHYSLVCVSLMMSRQYVYEDLRTLFVYEVFTVSLARNRNRNLKISKALLKS